MANAGENDNFDVIHIESYEEFSQYEGKKNVILDFYTDWCGPCKILGALLKLIKDKEFDKDPLLLKFQDKLKDLKVKVLKIDCENQDIEVIPQQYKVNSFPRLVWTHGYSNNVKESVINGYSKEYTVSMLLSVNEYYLSTKK